MQDCIFCKIINDELPSQRVYEDDKFIVFLDINPISTGHALVIPRKHSDDFATASPEVLAGMIKVAGKVAPAIKAAMKADGFNVGVNNGRAAGQLVDHVHFHIIPRFEEDGLKNWPGRGAYAEDEMARTAERIKKYLI